MNQFPLVQLCVPLIQRYTIGNLLLIKLRHKSKKPAFRGHDVARRS
jgi:hypothetical protein